MSKLPIRKSQMLPPMDDSTRTRSKLRQPTAIRKTVIEETTSQRRTPSSRSTSTPRKAQERSASARGASPSRATGLGTRIKQVTVRQERPGDAATGQPRVVREKSVIEVVPSQRSVAQERVNAAMRRPPSMVRQRTLSEMTRQPYQADLEELKRKEILAARITAREQAAKEGRLKAAERRAKVTVSKTKIVKPDGSRTVIREIAVKPKAGPYRIPMQYTRPDQDVVYSSPGELREQLRENLPLDLEYNWRDKHVPAHPDLDYYREQDVQSGSVYYGPTAVSDDEFRRRIPGVDFLEQRIDRTQRFDGSSESDKSPRRSPRTPRRSPRTPRFDDTPPAWSPFSYKSSVGSPERDIFAMTPPNWDELPSDAESVSFKQSTQRSPRTTLHHSTLIEQTPRRSPIRSPRTPRLDVTPPAWSPFSYKSSVGSPERDISAMTPPNWDELPSDAESVSFKKSTQRSPRTTLHHSTLIEQTPRRSPIRSPRTPRFDDTPPAWSPFSYKSSVGSPERDISAMTPPNWDELPSDAESVSFKKSPQRSPRKSIHDSSIIAQAPRRSPTRSPRTPRLDVTPPAWSPFSYKSSVGSPERDIFAMTPPNWDELPSDAESVSFKKSPQRSPRTPIHDSSIIAQAPRRSPIRSPRTPRRSPIRSPRTPRLDVTPPSWSPFSYKSSAGSPELDISNISAPQWAEVSSGDDSIHEKSVTHSKSATGDDIVTVTEKFTKPSKETVISTSTVTSKRTPDNDPRLVKQLIEEENEDVDIAMNLMPMELASFKPEKYVLRRKLNQMRAQSRSMVILEESSKLGITADDPTEEMQPEVAAAIMHTEEKGLTLGSPPTRIYNYLFPESGEPVIGVSSAGPAPLQDVVVPISSPSAQQRSTMNSEFERAVIITQSTSQRPHDHIYSESGRDSWRTIRSPKKSKKTDDEKDAPNLDDTAMSELIGAAPSSTQAQANDMPSLESRGLEYLLIPEPPRHSNKVQLRGSTLPPWFPGYYMTFPEFSETVRLTHTPSVAITAAWKMMKPAAFPENSRFVV